MNYTWATNLLKTQDMQTGAVSYKNNKLVKKCYTEKNKDMVRVIMKTKTEAFPDFEKDYRDYLMDLEREKNAKIKAEKMAKEEEEKKGKEEKAKAKKEWDDFFGAQDKEDKVMAGGHNEFLEDDFM